MTQWVEFEGERYPFADDKSDADIQKFLSGVAGDKKKREFAKSTQDAADREVGEARGLGSHAWEAANTPVTRGYIAKAGKAISDIGRPKVTGEESPTQAYLASLAHDLSPTGMASTWSKVLEGMLTPTSLATMLASGGSSLAGGGAISSIMRSAPVAWGAKAGDVGMSLLGAADIPKALEQGDYESAGLGLAGLAGWGAAGLHGSQIGKAPMSQLPARAKAPLADMLAGALKPERAPWLGGAVGAALGQAGLPGFGAVGGAYAGARAGKHLSGLYGERASKAATRIRSSFDDSITIPQSLSDSTLEAAKRNPDLAPEGAEFSTVTAAPADILPPDFLPLTDQGMDLNLNEMAQVALRNPDLVPEGQMLPDNFAAPADLLPPDILPLTDQGMGLNMNEMDFSASARDKRGKRSRFADPAYISAPPLAPSDVKLGLAGEVPNIAETPTPDPEFTSAKELLVKIMEEEDARKRVDPYNLAPTGKKSKGEIGLDEADPIDLEDIAPPVVKKKRMGKRAPATGLIPTENLTPPVPIVPDIPAPPAPPKGRDLSKLGNAARQTGAVNPNTLAPGLSTITTEAATLKGIIDKVGDKGISVSDVRMMTEGSVTGFDAALGHLINGDAVSITKDNLIRPKGDGGARPSVVMGASPSKKRKSTLDRLTSQTQFQRIHKLVMDTSKSFNQYSASSKEILYAIDSILAPEQAKLDKHGMPVQIIDSDMGKKIPNEPFVIYNRELKRLKMLALIDDLAKELPRVVEHLQREKFSFIHHGEPKKVLVRGKSFELGGTMDSGAKEVNIYNPDGLNEATFFHESGGHVGTEMIARMIADQIEAIYKMRGSKRLDALFDLGNTPGVDKDWSDFKSAVDAGPPVSKYAAMYKGPLKDRVARRMPSSSGRSTIKVDDLYDESFAELVAGTRFPDGGMNHPIPYSILDPFLRLQQLLKGGPK